MRAEAQTVCNTEARAVSLSRPGRPPHGLVDPLILSHELRCRFGVGDPASTSPDDGPGGLKIEQERNRFLLRRAGRSWSTSFEQIRETGMVILADPNGLILETVATRIS